MNIRTGTVPVTDTLIGDDTGEIRLVGWRDQSPYLDKLKIGERIKVIGVVGNNGRDGKVEITLKPYSSILKIS